MRARWTLALVLLAPLVGSSVGAGPASGPALPPSDVLDEAVGYLRSKMDANGCVVGDAAATAWSVIAAAAAGHDPHDGAPSLVDGLRACPPPRTIGDPETPYLLALERHVLAIAAAGEDPRSFDGTDRIDELRSYWSGVQFLDPSVPAGVNDDAWAILALRAAGFPASDVHVQGAAQFVLANQNGDGGWGHATAAASTTDDTAAFLEALAWAGALDAEADARAEALAFLEGKADDGGRGCFGHGQWGGNVDSTTWAVLALLAIGEDPRHPRWGTDEGPWDCILAHQQPNGSFGTASGVNLLTTPQAILALAAVPHGRATLDLQRPTATLTTSAEPVAGEPVDLVATGVAFAGWQLATGDVLEGARAEWWPTRAGPASFEVLLVDEDGVGSLAGFTTTVRAPSSSGGGGGSSTPGDQGSAPAVAVDAPAAAERNVTTGVNLTVTVASAPVVAVRLDWGDGTDTGWSPLIEHTHVFSSLGAHTLTAWAKDADGRVSEPVERSLEVVDAGPRVRIEAPASVHRHEPFQATAHASDPDGPPPTLTWQLGDQRATGTDARFTLDVRGEHTVTVVAEDAAGNSAQAQAVVLALNRAPHAPTVAPLSVPTNATIVLTANARDPEGDALTFTWYDGEQLAWGPQFHLSTGGPGVRELTLNVSDAHGGWTLATVTVRVAEAPDQGPRGAVHVEGSEAPRAPDPPVPTERPESPVPSPATVTLAPRVAGEPDVATLVEGSAHQPNGTVRAIEVVLAGAVPVRGTSAFVALVPPLPAGTYDLAARAMGVDDLWGPWANATLVVAPPVDEPLGDLATTDPSAQPSNDVPWPAPFALLALALAAWRRRP